MNQNLIQIRKGDLWSWIRWSYIF